MAASSWSPASKISWFFSATERAPSEITLAEFAKASMFFCEPLGACLHQQWEDPAQLRIWTGYQDTIGSRRSSISPSAIEEADSSRCSGWTIHIRHDQLAPSSTRKLSPRRQLEQVIAWLMGAPTKLHFQPAGEASSPSPSAEKFRSFPADETVFRRPAVSSRWHLIRAGVAALEPQTAVRARSSPFACPGSPLPAIRLGLQEYSRVHRSRLPQPSIVHLSPTR